MKIRNISLFILLITIFSVVSFLVYKQILSYGHYASDTDEHIIILYRFFYEPNYYISHPLWHIITFYFSKVLHLSIENSAILSSATLVSFWVYLVYHITENTVRPAKQYIAVLITIVIIVIGPLCIPWYNKIIFYGQGSPNIWHNVTLWTVKPFALLSVMSFLKGVEDKNIKFYAVSILFAVVSIFAKPSFIIMYLPALLGFIIVKHLYRDRKVLGYIFLLGLISVGILSYQFLNTFYEGESKVIIDLFGVWSKSSQNIPASIVLALAFPMFFTLLESNILNDNRILLSWFMIIVGIFYYAVFAQTGRFYLHGNFGWSYVIAMSFIYLFTIVKFFEIYKQLSIFKRYSLFSLLFIQMLTGLYYLIRILEGWDPLYIAFYPVL